MLTGVLDFNRTELELDMENKTKENLVWVDLEMTGLDVNKEHIIEMACLVTDKNLNPLCEGLNIVIHQPDHILDAMGEWCTKHHCESGRKNYFINSSSVIFSTVSVQFN